MIPQHHLFRRLFLRDGRTTPISMLPDTTYLERWDCISLLDRPISEADGPADAIRQPVVAARPRRAAVPGRAARPRRAARACPAWRRTMARPRYPGGYRRLHRQPRARARASARSPAGAARDGSRSGRGAPNPDQLERYIENGCHWYHELPDRMNATTGMPTGTISTGPTFFGLHRQRRADRLPALLRAAAEVPPGRARPRRGPPPAEHRERIATLFRSRCRSGIRRSRRRRSTTRTYPAARHHPAADGDVSFLGLAECLAAADPRPQLALHATSSAPPSSASPMATG